MNASSQATCQYPKRSGELCKRPVNKGETSCWQHARGFRHKWKSLTRNQTIAFSASIAGIVGLPLGIAALLFPLFYPTSSKKEIATEVVQNQTFANLELEGFLVSLIAPGDENEILIPSENLRTEEELRKSADLKCQTMRNQGNVVKVTERRPWEIFPDDCAEARADVDQLEMSNRLLKLIDPSDHLSIDATIEMDAFRIVGNTSEDCELFAGGIGRNYDHCLQFSIGERWRWPSRVARVRLGEGFRGIKGFSAGLFSTKDEWAKISDGAIYGRDTVVKGMSVIGCDVVSLPAEREKFLSQFGQVAEFAVAVQAFEKRNGKISLREFNLKKGKPKPEKRPECRTITYELAEGD